TLTLLRADAGSGKTRELITERSDTWVDLNDELTLLKKSPQIIWSSTRSGHTHLYLYDYDGKLLRPLTHGDWHVVGEGGERAIRGVDERNDTVYFMSDAETPLERQLYAVSLRSPDKPRRLTEDSGWHAVTLS